MSVKTLSPTAAQTTFGASSLASSSSSLPLPSSSSSSSSSLAISPLPSPTTLAKWQQLPPLLSRLPPALLASPLSDPAPIAKLTLTAMDHQGQNSLSGVTGAAGMANSHGSNSSTSISKSHDNTQAPPHLGYTESHLPAIDQASLALHYALYRFRVIDVEHYATAPYQEAFNWQDLELPVDLEREWYIVAFRSVRAKGADTARLYKADRDAHEEAVTAGGLLLYWYGSPNENGENLATCIWQSRKHALLANRNPKHAVAAKLASTTYETYTLERYVLRKVKGTTSVSVVPWESGEVGF